MEVLSNELLPVWVLLLAAPFLILAIGVAFKKRSDRRFRDSMKRGNQIYREWRADTEKQPLD